MTTTETPARTSTRPLTQKMRAAVVDRNWVKYPQAKALQDRGLATYQPWSEHTTGRYELKLTEAGQVVREGILAPLKPGVRVRNTLTGLVGRVVRIERAEGFDIVVLLWDGSENETCGSAAYLEVVGSEPPAPAKVQRLLDVAARHDELVATEDDTSSRTRTWAIKPVDDQRRQLRGEIWIYWTPAANGGSLTVAWYRSDMRSRRTITQAQAAGQISRLAGH